MIDWNDLYITQDGKHLVVDVQISSDDNYKNVGLASVIVQPVECDSIKDFSVLGPTSKALYTTVFDAIHPYDNSVLTLKLPEGSYDRQLTDNVLKPYSLQGTGQQYDVSQIMSILSPNTTYTMSFWARSDNKEDARMYVYLMGYLNALYTSDFSNVRYNKHVMKQVRFYDDWTLYSITFTTSDNVLKNSDDIQIFFPQSDAQILITPIKIEKGEASTLYQNDVLTRRKRLVYDIDGFGNDLIFVYAFAQGTYADGTPCGMTHNMITGAVWNHYPVYQSAMKMLGTLDNSCKPDSQFIDWLLRYNAFRVCLEAGDYQKAAQYWCEFFKDNVSSNTATNCGCS